MAYDRFAGIDENFRFPPDVMAALVSSPEVQNLRQWGNLQGVPSTFPPSPHQHTWDSIQNKPDYISYDSGERNMTADLLNGWTASSNTVRLRRLGNRVILTMDWSSLSLSGSQATSDDFMALPIGFRPTGFRRTSLGWLGDNTRTPNSMECTSSGILTMTSRASFYFGQIEWSTNQALPSPTALPGTPA